QRRAGAEGKGICRSRAYVGRIRLRDPLPTGPAELPLAAARALEPRIRPRDSRRVIPQLSRPRPAAADAELGIDAEGGHPVSAAATAGGIFPRLDDLARHPRIQSARRWFQGYFRPATVREMKRWTRH